MVTAVERRKRLFTVADYHRMAEYGILGGNERVELIEGEIIEMNPIGSPHAACVKRLTRLLVRAAGDRAIVGIQDPVQLGDLSEPQPDIALLKPRSDFYGDAHPGPEDILLLVEVADSTLAYDRNRKLPLYARSGVPEAWIVDLESRVIEVYRNPSSEGYREAVRKGLGASLPIPGLPGATLDIDQVLG